MKKLLIAVSAYFVCMSGAYAAGDIEAGKATVQKMCTSCHGANGISPAPIWPNLAGQKAAYMVKQLKDFKAGKRQDPSMNGMANMLSDQDVENVAAYYESLK